jgi:hypothetical protein
MIGPRPFRYSVCAKPHAAEPTVLELSHASEQRQFIRRRSTAERHAVKLRPFAAWGGKSYPSRDLR